MKTMFLISVEKGGFIINGFCYLAEFRPKIVDLDKNMAANRVKMLRMNTKKP